MQCTTLLTAIYFTWFESCDLSAEERNFLLMLSQWVVQNKIHLTGPLLAIPLPEVLFITLHALLHLCSCKVSLTVTGLHAAIVNKKFNHFLHDHALSSRCSLN